MTQDTRSGIPRWMQYVAAIAVIILVGGFIHDTHRSITQGERQTEEQTDRLREAVDKIR